MGYIASIIISIIAIIFLLRYISLSRQVRKMRMNLKTYNDRDSKQTLEIALGNRAVEQLGTEINRLMNQKNRVYAEKKRKELELKRAITGMSHDLRTPLTSIIGYLQLMENPSLDPEKRKEYIQISKKKAHSLQALITNFFSLSTADSEEIPLKIEKVNATKIIKEVILSYYDLFMENRLEPKLVLPDEDLFIYADENACKRVVENLIINSVQHANGDIKIRLDTEDSSVKFMVENDWKLGEKPDINRVFERFYTADPSRQYSHGLGLAIVKSLLDKMDGEINAQIENERFKIICHWQQIKD